MVIPSKGYGEGFPRKGNLYGVDCIAIFRKLEEVFAIRRYSPSIVLDLK